MNAQECGYSTINKYPISAALRDKTRFTSSHRCHQEVRLTLIVSLSTTLTVSTELTDYTVLEGDANITSYKKPQGFDEIDNLESLWTKLLRLHLFRTRSDEKTPSSRANFHQYRRVRGVSGRGTRKFPSNNYLNKHCH